MGEWAAVNALTVDVEEHYQTHVLDVPMEEWDNQDSRVVPNVHRLLDLFADYGVQGTFFVVGAVAEAHPSLVKEIARQGHEIGSHSGRHQLLGKMDEASFREDVRRTKAMLEDLSGQAVVQYRAPSWSLDFERYEWLSILEEEGIMIDSSIQPFRTVLSGSNAAPVMPFHPVVGGRRLGLLEFPSTVWTWGGLRMPFLGGFYLRALPAPLVLRMLRNIQNFRAGMLYVHPWELDPDQPRLSASLRARMFQYFGLRRVKDKLAFLLEHVRFQPMGQLADELMKTGAVPAIRIK